MKITFRWYGSDDPVTLEKIRQIPVVSGIVSAVYTTPVGQVWSEAEVSALCSQIKKSGLEFEVIESVPVHESIKLGLPEASRLIQNYCENIRLVARHGIKVVCYNFMPVFDWLRTDLTKPLDDGSNVLAYDHAAVIKTDPTKKKLSLPGWDESYSLEEIKEVIGLYNNLGEEGLWRNFITFLEAVAPVAMECGVKLAIHPDDPPWPIFGLPRIIKNRQDIERMLKAVPLASNGITLCTGSLGAAADNDLIDMAARFAERTYFAHIRNVATTAPFCFEERAHPSECGSLDICRIIKTLRDSGFDGYIRPDHGRMIWGEQGRPGYGLYDRALGAMYIAGCWQS